jgi:prepilin-type N-terminal cleavage/methylation domain-containing protein
MSGTSRQAGFSLIEVLIAAGIMLIVALGVLPLFTQSMVNNSAGNDYTQVSNYAKSELERLNELPFDSPSLTIPAGQPSIITTDFYSPTRRRWVTAVVLASEKPTWTRTITVEQCSLSGVENGRCEATLPGGATPAFVHVKDIEVAIVGGRPQGGILGTGKRITLATMKPF